MKNTFAVRRQDLLLSSDQSLLDLDFVHKNLTTSYWSPGIPKETVEKAIANSLALGLYLHDKQIGFCRIITDYSTFAYLADVFIVEKHRGNGFAVWMTEELVKIPALQGLRRWVLATRDAHSLYEKSGWKPLQNPEFFMEIIDRDVYKKG
ncbi:GNAT family N-acetyltransferase [Marinilongibacter aquaticus]|uniref:GNAT family N-acetyltransferase n=1 Tax=Marinilongibacter aquaticus TaxID=2975157 RepID=UPI0021BD4825|nr:GNAT family N-acetyltransferase [Marinilongibacter aquaticus]UBM60534.1 GNAT family N-acetyltransferase [Marinilongibacter aquaticus]